MSMDVNADIKKAVEDSGEEQTIPVDWVIEQIWKHPGRHASSWKYLLELRGIKVPDHKERG